MRTDLKASNADHVARLPTGVWSKVYERLGVRDRACLAAVNRDTYAYFAPDLRRLHAVRDATHLALEPRPAAARPPHLAQRSFDKSIDLIAYAADALEEALGPQNSMAFNVATLLIVCLTWAVALPSMGVAEIIAARVKTLYRRKKDRRERKYLLRLALALDCGHVPDAAVWVKRLKPTNANLPQLSWDKVVAQLQADDSKLAPELSAFVDACLTPEVAVATS